MSRTLRTPLALKKPNSLSESAATTPKLLDLTTHAAKKRKSDAISDEEGDTSDTADALLDNAMATSALKDEKESAHTPGPLLGVVKYGVNAGRSYFYTKGDDDKFTYFKWADESKNDPRKRLQQLEDALASLTAEVIKLRKLVDNDNCTQ